MSNITNKQVIEQAQRYIEQEIHSPTNTADYRATISRILPDVDSSEEKQMLETLREKLEKLQEKPVSDDTQYPGSSTTEQ